MAQEYKRQRGGYAKKLSQFTSHKNNREVPTQLANPDVDQHSPKPWKCRFIFGLTSSDITSGDDSNYEYSSTTFLFYYLFCR